MCNAGATMMIYSLTNGKKKLIQITLAIVFACVLAFTCYLCH